MKVPAGMVVTPFGVRPKALVHTIEPGHVFDASQVQLQKPSTSEEVVANREELHASGTRIMSGRVAPLTTPIPPDSPQEIVGAAWAGPTTPPVFQYQAEWIVPPPPSTYSDQLIYIFNAMGNWNQTCQAALQWGNNGAFGGPEWSVACWYDPGTAGGPVQFSVPITVNVGDTLIGRITLDGPFSGSGPFSYSVGLWVNSNPADGGSPTVSLPIRGIPSLFFYLVQAVRASGITECSCYPATLETVFSGIEVLTGNPFFTSFPTLNWVPWNTVTDCGQQGQVVSNANPGGIVTLFYRPPVRSFSRTSAEYVYVLDQTGDLWFEPATSWPDRTGQGLLRVDGRVWTFQVIDANDVYVLGTDGNLWLEPSSGWPAGTGPGHRLQVDGSVQSFGAIDANNVYVLGTDGNLWFEPSSGWPAGRGLGHRQQVDGNVQAFYAIDPDHVYVLGTDGNLWFEPRSGWPFGKGPGKRQQVDGHVQAFWPIDANNVYVLGTDGNLWFEPSSGWPFGNGPGKRQQVDGNVRAFQGVDSNHVYVLGTDGNLWFEPSSGWPSGTGPGRRQQVDGTVWAFHAVNNQNVYVLGSDGKLWLEPASGWPAGTGPGRRQLVDQNVAF